MNQTSKYQLTPEAKADMARNIPVHMHESIVNYVEHGLNPGSFLFAVLSNNLRESFGCADEINRQYIFSYVQFMYNHMPAGIWGGPEAVLEHIENMREQKPDE